MLGKLIKHEFLDTYKLICSYYAILTVLTVLGAITVKTSESTHVSTSIFLQILMFITSLGYMVMMGILGLITLLALCTHFNNTMYGDRGYLTHTLPVSKGSILASKYIVAVIWCIVSLIVMFLSAMIFGSFLSGENLFVTLFVDFSKEQWQAIDEFTQKTLGCSVSNFVLLAILTLIVTVMHLLSFIWMAISIGQLANEKRKLVGIIAGITIWFVEIIIKRLIQGLLHLSLYGNLVQMIVTDTGRNLQSNQTLILSLVIELAFFTIETFGIWFISSKKLNLA